MIIQKYSFPILLSFAVIHAPSVSTADEPASRPSFATEILPIFKANCMRCHGADRQRAELNLSTVETIRKGGESGTVIVPGDLKKSKLMHLVESGEMPPGKRRRLSAKDVALIREWIESGAHPLAEVKPEEAVSQHDIIPLMHLRCAACHGKRRQEAGLDLRTKTAMLEGGKSGPAFVPGQPEKSLILKRIHAGEMPPRKQLLKVSVKPMRDEEIEKLTKWIKDGAPEIDIEPDVATTEPDPLVTDSDRDFWAFQPPRDVSVPDIDSKRIRNPIDAFLLRKLGEKGLKYLPEADRLTLIRRASFDLTGLPPSPEEVQTFLQDKSPDAYEKMIDRLLASRRYGERWGRYWLDLVGYADSEGKRSADPIRPYAWRYRDYVIRSFNMDKPYDRFLLEQIAGDELVDYENAPVITQEIQDNLVATGFLRMTPDGTGSDVVNFVPNRLDVIADSIQVFGSAVLGMTLHCARCHSHKYDPIPHRDYHRLAAVFRGALDEHDWMRPAFVPGQARSERPSRVLPYVTPEEKKRHAERKKKIEEEIALLKKQPKEYQDGRRVRALEAILKQPPMIRALWDRGEPSPMYMYRRGDYLQPTRLIGPGVPSVLTDGKTPFEVKPPYSGATSTGRRLALAKWLIQPDHPLTGRVIVNRIWKFHFGQGIVKTLDNFGNTGARPTHPELLDWLAREFIRKKWSIKAMHRLMMNSAAYRQSSQLTALHEKHDPDNQWLSRMPLKRMDAEVLYDTMLLVSGRLDETPFGLPDPVLVRDDGLVVPVPNERGYRRSVYVRQRRTQILTMLDVFDMPQMNPNCVARIPSTVASQALLLKNNKLIRELAESFANRVQRSADKIADQIDDVYWLALSRPPSAEEHQIGIQALSNLTRFWSKTVSEEEAERRALSTYCHTILNSAAFLYID